MTLMFAHDALYDVSVIQNEVKFLSGSYNRRKTFKANFAIFNNIGFMRLNPLYEAKLIKLRARKKLWLKNKSFQFSN